MHEQSNWSVGLGRWWGLRVRLHMFFVLFAAVTLYLSLNVRTGPEDIQWVAALSLGILLVSVLIHELGHYHAATRLGGMIHQSVLVPWGGLSTLSAPRDPQSELITHLAGPIVNLAICLICIPMLLALDGVSVLGLLHPIRPVGILDPSAWTVALKLTFWINWLLFIVNLIPAYPFDGGRIFRAALARALGRRQATLVVARTAQFAALALVVIAWLVRDSGGGVVPIWFALIVLSIFLFFSASKETERRERDPIEDELFGYDFSQGYTSLERSTDSLDEENPSPISQWLEQRRLARQQREHEQEVDEERRVDEILARLHDVGMDGLNEEERAILERVSARYRNRMGDRM